MEAHPQQKMREKGRKMKKFGFTRKNPRRFPGVTVVVVTFFVEILAEFHDFVSECVLFPRKNQQPVLGGDRFSEEK